ncbi:MAG: hypothetical protein E7477_01585 [Ruminococcaceae bacterium]|nr:hypothetical protein [Oscillospiraceae bacterium]
MIQKALGAPEWLTRGAVYQINPRTFSSEGTLKAITKELPFLAEMGFTTIYLCPIFEHDASENRDNWSDRQKKYETQNPKNQYRMNDYFAVDEEYGTMEDLRECVDECHRLGMRLLLDLVYFHIGPNANILRSHPEFAKQDEDGNFINGPWHFPQFDFNHQGLREYLWCNMVYYISVLDVDGFRCDVADMVPLDFWYEARRRITAVKPDAVLINEGSDGRSLYAAFDAIYGFSWHSHLYNVLFNGEKVTNLRADWDKFRRECPSGSFVLRDLENHDTVTDWPDRIEVMAGHRGMDMVLALNYTVDGLPMVYCGNEIADTAKVNMFANRFYPGKYEFTSRDADAKNTPDSLTRQSLVKKLNAFRKEDIRLVYGKTEWLDTDRPDDIIAFSRTYEGKNVWFICNPKTEPCTVNISGGIPTDAERVAVSGVEQKNENLFELEPYGFIIVRD